MRITLEFDKNLNLVDVIKEEVPEWVDDEQPIRNVYEDINYGWNNRVA